MSELVLKVEGLCKKYRQGDAVLEILRDTSLQLNAGDTMALVGASGSGKSTLLHSAALLDTPDAGTITICGKEAASADDRTRTLIRRAHIGFVYQFHHLLEEMTALENVCLPYEINEAAPADYQEKAKALLAEVGLADRMAHYPAQLSGGERQRVALARALAGDPALLLADEPTGSLDEQTAEEVMALILRLVKERNMAALIATHNTELARSLQREVHLSGGALKEVR